MTNADGRIPDLLPPGAAYHHEQSRPSRQGPACILSSINPAYPPVTDGYLEIHYRPVATAARGLNLAMGHELIAIGLLLQQVKRMILGSNNRQCKHEVNTVLHSVTGKVFVRGR